MNEWRQELIQDLQAQDILGARDILQQFISRIEVSYDHLRLYYRYPLNGDFSKDNPASAATLEGHFIDQQISSLPGDCLQSIFDVAPFLAPLPRKNRKKRPTNPRDLEIYRLHTEEKRTIASLAKGFGLAENSVWGICNRVGKRVTNEISR
jgi:hypothetical protein